jgi:hypothetical protein
MYVDCGELKFHHSFQKLNKSNKKFPIKNIYIQCTLCGQSEGLYKILTSVSKLMQYKNEIRKFTPELVSTVSMDKFPKTSYFIFPQKEN